MTPQLNDLSLILYGAGGHGKVVLDAALSMGNVVQCVIDDAPNGEEFLGRPLVSATHVDWAQLGAFRFVVTVGENATRSEIFQRLLELGGTPVNVIHRSAIVSSYAKMGRGNVVLANAVINPGAVIGDNCIINTAATIDHDCLVESNVHVCPGVHLAGAVTVGEGTMVGTGSSSIPGVKVGAWSIIGAGTVLVRDIPDHVVAFGSPGIVRRRLVESTETPPHYGDNADMKITQTIERLVIEVHKRNGGDLDRLNFDLSLLDRTLHLDSLDLAEILVGIERELGISPFESPSVPRTWRDILNMAEEKKKAPSGARGTATGRPEAYPT